MGADLPPEIHTALQQIYQRAAQTATISTSIQEANESSFDAPVPASSEIHPQNDRLATVTTPDNPRSESPTPDNGPLADICVEYGSLTGPGNCCDDVGAAYEFMPLVR
jgi:hypothetical protein